MKSLDDRIEIAQAFVYTAGQQAQIIALMQPLNTSAELFRVGYKPMLDERCNDVSGIPTSPEEACIDSVTRMARRGLVAFLEPRKTAKSEKERLARYAAALELAAGELEAEVPEPGVGGEMVMPLCVLELLERVQAQDPSLPRDALKDIFAENRALSAALHRRAGFVRRVLDGIDEEYASNFLSTAHNPNRWRLAFELLDRQMIERREWPGRSRTSDAAKLLLAALDPAMIYAKRVLGISEARPLRTGDNAENMIRRWQPPFTEEAE